MIYVSTVPYRISLLGGGSDLGWYLQKYGYGLSLGYPLDLHTHLAVQFLGKDAKQGILNYSSREYYDSVDNITHEYLRSTLSYYNILEKINLSSFGLSSGGGGLGGSSSFLIALIAVIYGYKEKEIDAWSLAKEAAQIEIDVLGKSIGKQDHFLCSSPGLSAFRFTRTGQVEIIPLSQNKRAVLETIIDSLVLVPSGTSRSSNAILAKLANSIDSYEKISSIRDIAEDFIYNGAEDSLVIQDNFNNAMISSWNIKQKMSGVLTLELAALQRRIESLEINWLRLVGAGGGGYFLVSPKTSAKHFILECESRGIYGCIKANMSLNSLKLLKI